MPESDEISWLADLLLTILYSHSVSKYVITPEISPLAHHTGYRAVSHDLQLCRSTWIVDYEGDELGERTKFRQSSALQGWRCQ